MNEILSEKEVLNVLGIPNFRCLTKDKVIQMASLFDRMDPEVARSAIEQFPNFANTMLEMVDSSRKSIETGLEKNEKSILKTHEGCLKILDSLDRELQRKELSFEEKKYIIEQMKEVQEMMNRKDSENKKFILSMNTLVLATVFIGGITLATVLGGKTEINLDGVKKLINKG